MRSLIALGIIVLTAGCATTAKYNETINSWVGSKEIDLIKSWNPPKETYETQGSKFLVYSWSQYMEGIGTAYCKTVFEVQQGIITSVKATGNDCTK
jgi:hypothetical protein